MTKPKPILPFVCLAATLVLAAGCASGPEKKDRDFSTSGSRDADQRADQRMAKAEQLNSDDNGGKKVDKGTGAVVAEEKKTLYDRIGGAEGSAALIDDVVTRWIADPQVNFERKGVKTGGLGFGRNTSQEWQATKLELAEIKKNLVQFIAVKAGGPVRYDGPEFAVVAKDRHVSNAEFDAAVGDLKASLDKLKIANEEQKEVIALMENTRPQIVTEH